MVIVEKIPGRLTMDFNVPWVHHSLFSTIATKDPAIYTKGYWQHGEVTGKVRVTHFNVGPVQFPSVIKAWESVEQQALAKIAELP